MKYVGPIVRFLMLVACLVPFTSTRQAMAAFSLAPIEAPATEKEEHDEQEDNEREELADGKEKARQARPTVTRQLLAAPPHTLTLSPLSAPNLHFSIPLTAPAPLDPFRNGLGTPYRC